jgi:hypothetical protein
MRTSRIRRLMVLLSALAAPAIGLAQAVTFTNSLNPVTPGQTITFTGTTTLAVSATGATVKLYYYNSSNTYIGVSAQTVNFVAGVPQALSLSYATASSLPAGTYHYNLSYYDHTGAGLAGAYGQTSDGTFVVGTQSAATYSITATPSPAAPSSTMSFVSKLYPGVGATNVTVKLWMYNSSNAYIGVATKTGVNFASGQITPVTITYAVPSGLAAGTYHYNLSYYESDGSTALPGATNQTNAGNYAVATGASPSAICANAVVVGLKWPAVASATSYTVSRNGGTLGSTSLLTYSDQTVSPSTTYNYSIQAFNGATALSTKTIDVTTTATSANGDPAYCPSTVLNPVSVGWGSAVLQLNGSDLWGQTLGSDGYQYGFFGDGGGFGATDSTPVPPAVSWGIGAVTSTTPGSLSTAVNVYGGVSQEHAANISGKSTSILAIGPSNSQNFYALGGVKATGSGTKGGANTLEIVYSPGNAWTWTDNQSNWIFCSGNNGASTTDFCPTAFLQNGPGYSGNTDGYVYMYGGTQLEFYGNGTPGVQYTYLWRVKSTQAQILNNLDYEAFTGLDANGNPTWISGPFSTLKANMKPVYTDPQARPLPISEITYNAGLGRYIASVEGLVNQVAFYEAPNPWGPWASIGYFNSNPSDNSGGWGNLGQGIAFSDWGNGVHGDACGINFIDKWMSTNGQTMWLVFSSDGNASGSATISTLQGKDMDGFLTLPLTITPK